MPPAAKLGLGTEGGKQLVSDFQNWKTTGWKPNAKVIGGKDHYMSRTSYQDVTPNTFRAAAKKAAIYVLSLMAAKEKEELDRYNQNDEEEEAVCDNINRNPFVQAKHINGDKDSDSDEEGSEQGGTSDDESENEETDGEEGVGFNHDEEEDDDDDWDIDEHSSTGSDYSDDLLEDDYDKMTEHELTNVTAPIVCCYPNDAKVGVLFMCEGDVKDMTSNQFEFSTDGKEIKWYVRVPRERLNAAAMIGDKKGSVQNDGNIMMLQAVIDRRRKGHKADQNGAIWELKDTIILPFPCAAKLYDKNGKRIKKYILKRNEKGFAWGYFWLLPIENISLKQPQRNGGQKVSVPDSSSVYTYDDETFRSQESNQVKRPRTHQW